MEGDADETVRMSVPFGVRFFQIKLYSESHTHYHILRVFMVWGMN